MLNVENRTLSIVWYSTIQDKEHKTLGLWLNGVQIYSLIQNWIFKNLQQYTLEAVNTKQPQYYKLVFLVVCDEIW